MSERQMPPLPARMAKLKTDHRGFVVPWFVQWMKSSRPGDCPRYPGCGCMTQSGPHSCEHKVAADSGEGEPDFRIMDGVKLRRAINEDRCWVCGEAPIGQYKAFVIGPMCAINRVIGEPPSHRDCALYSAKACPFLTRPRMRRNEKDLPEERESAGFAIKRNPGVICVWVTKSYQPFRPSAGGKGVLFSLGDPIDTLWFCEGRLATRDEVMASIDSGYPQLEALAQQEPGGMEALAASRQIAMSLLPA